MPTTTVLYEKQEILEKSGLDPQKFRRRTKGLGMLPDLQGYYTQEDLEILNQLDDFLRRKGGTIKTFLEIYHRSKK